MLTRQQKTQHGNSRFFRLFSRSKVLWLNLAALTTFILVSKTSNLYHKKHKKPQIDKTTVQMPSKFARRKYFVASSEEISAYVTDDYAKPMIHEVSEEEAHKYVEAIHKLEEEVSHKLKEESVTDEEKHSTDEHTETKEDDTLKTEDLTHIHTDRRAILKEHMPLTDEVKEEEEKISVGARSGFVKKKKIKGFNMVLKNILIENKDINYDDNNDVLVSLSKVIYSMDKTLKDSVMPPVANHVLARIMNPSIYLHKHFEDIKEINIINNANENICTKNLKVFNTTTYEKSSKLKVLIHREDEMDTDTERHIFIWSESDKSHNVLCKYEGISTTPKISELKRVTASYAGALLSMSQKIAAYTARVLMMSRIKGKPEVITVYIDKTILTQHTAAYLLGIKPIQHTYIVIGDLICVYASVIMGAMCGIDYAKAQKHLSTDQLNIHISFKDKVYMSYLSMHSKILANAMRAINIASKLK